MYLCQLTAIYQSEEAGNRRVDQLPDIKTFKKKFKRVPLAFFVPNPNNELIQESTVTTKTEYISKEDTANKKIEESKEGPQKVVINVNFDNLQAAINSPCINQQPKKLDEFKIEDIKPAITSQKQTHI